VPDARERDLVLAPNEYAFISDQTKGNINVYVGPHKTSMANTDRPVFFNNRSKRFERCNLDESIKLNPTAPEGWYVVLKNPADNNTQPRSATVSGLPGLQIGHKVNIPGPVSFALWPGQMVRVLQGHRLRSNQYLLVRVYDEEAARENWSKAVIKTRDADGVEQPELPELPELTVGRTLVIRGTDVSFYIPPTGIEVVRDAAGRYVRQAVTLERLEYCILLDEDGTKRFIQGPAVVFPEPSETFVERFRQVPDRKAQGGTRRGARKFRAIELNELSGLYIKVIAPFTDGGADYVVGQELFITGREQMIYFPRPEHAIIKYGEQEIHHAVAIPKGEGRYCLDRVSGQIRLVRGPAMFLPDPRREVIVRRVLPARKVAMWFPGNQEALAYNERLARRAEEASEVALEGFAGDDFQRKRQYTPPRSITLDTKYDGAVTIGVWTGYAVLVTSKGGSRRVVAGPQTYLLEYDETLESIELSTGTPKTDANKLKTVYLRVLHNKISDIVRAETQDLCNVEIRLSYRVNFEGEPETWFDVEDFVKFLTDHMRSMLRNAIKQVGIRAFHADAIRFVRDTVLGASVQGSGRPGRLFEENGMRIYDVEVLDVKIGDTRIEKLLTEAQHSVVNQTLELAAERRRLEFVRASEEVRRAIAEEQAKTRQATLSIKEAEIARQHAVRLAEIDAETGATRRSLGARSDDQETISAIQQAELSRKRAAADVDHTNEARRLEQRLTWINAEVQAVVSKAGAVSPDLIAALQSFSDQAMVEKVAESMAPLAILGGDSVADVLSKLLKGTKLDGVVRAIEASGSGD